MIVSGAGESPFRVAAAYVIGADGAHSTVRKALGLSFEGAAYPQDFLLADCAVDWPFDYDRLSIFVRGRGFAAYFPERGQRRGRIIAIGSKHGDASEPLARQGSTDVPLSMVQEVVREVTGAEVMLSDPTWTSQYRVHHRGVDRYGAGRVFVAGDAAHIHSPAGGQGMNTGLQDAANLAWKLAAVLNGAPATLLQTYNAERWPIGRKLLDRTDRMFSAMTSDSRLVAGLRNLALPVFGRAAMRSESVRARAFHFVSELGIRYHQGPFVSEEGSSGVSPKAQALRAGARAPDGRIGRTQSVFDLLRADRFTVLVLSAKALEEDAIATIRAALDSLPASIAGLDCQKWLIARSLIGRDSRLMQAESNDVFVNYQLDERTPQMLVLIRPDGYIAYRCFGTDTAGLTTFVARFSAQAA